MSKVADELITKTIQELNTPERIKSMSRVWKDPKAYRYLVQWSNLVLLRYLVRLFTSSLPKSEYRRKAQLDDAARSTVRNIEEGWKRSNTSDYLSFIGYSQGSLEEVKGDVRELTEDGFLPSKPGSSLLSLGLNLGDFNNALKPKGNLKENIGNIEDVDTLPSFKIPLSSFNYVPINILYPPLKSVKASDLTYEVFIELINKTDYLLRKLVESLENKLGNDQKYYKIEQERIKEKFKKK